MTPSENTEIKILENRGCENEWDKWKTIRNSPSNISIIDNITTTRKLDNEDDSQDDLPTVCELCTSIGRGYACAPLLHLIYKYYKSNGIFPTITTPNMYRILLSTLAPAQRTRPLLWVCRLMLLTQLALLELAWTEENTCFKEEFKSGWIACLWLFWEIEHHSFIAFVWMMFPSPILIELCMTRHALETLAWTYRIFRGWKG